MICSFIVSKDKRPPEGKPFLGIWKGRTYLCEFVKTNYPRAWDVSMTKTPCSMRCCTKDEFYEHFTGWMPLPEVKVERKKRKKSI